MRMRIGGLQKLTLLDFPGKIACTVFTVGCNFRCPFCHNASLVTHTDDAGSFSEGELMDFLRKRQGVLEGVAITGGEPMLWPDLPELMAEIRALGFAVKLDTNGSFPDRLAGVLERGLADYVAMDVKNSPEKYALTAGTAAETENVKRSVRLLLDRGGDYEFRTTVVKGLHEPADIEAAARWIRGAKRYYLQAFRDSGDLIGEGLSAFSPKEMQTLLEAARKEIPNTEIRGE